MVDGEKKDKRFKTNERRGKEHQIVFFLVFFDCHGHYYFALFASFKMIVFKVFS